MSIDVGAIHAATPSPVEVARRLGMRIARASARDRARVGCPWHHDNDPSCDLAIKDGRLVAICRSCGNGGDLFALVAAVDGLDPRRDFRAVAEHAAELVGVSLSEGAAFAHPPKQRDPHSDLVMAIDQSADRWLRGCGEREGEPVVLPRDAEIIRGASNEELEEAMADLREIDAIHAEADAELERLADLHAQGAAW